ncbi:MAG: CpsD/CapB family tyrosine-protein kinase [Faecousia sp.]
MLTPEETKKTIGANLNFAAAEAYKLLRTNLAFSLPVKDGCQIIGVTSALRGEGKSTTAINIAYTIAQTQKNVLLIEADLRLSTIAKRLQLRPRPGLTNFMIGQYRGNDVLQKSGLHPNLWVITAGDTPPNPAELLGSKPMEVTLKAMSELFDVIIVDLPPVTAVTDALVVSKHLDGMLVVVRQDYCDRAAVDETVRQLRFADTKILGFVMTGADTHKKTYKRYGSYGDYRQHASRESGK